MFISFCGDRNDVVPRDDHGYRSAANACWLSPARKRYARLPKLLQAPPPAVLSYIRFKRLFLIAFRKYQTTPSEKARTYVSDLGSVAPSSSAHARVTGA